MRFLQRRRKTSNPLMYCSFRSYATCLELVNLPNVHVEVGGDTVIVAVEGPQSELDKLQWPQRHGKVARLSCLPRHLDFLENTSGFSRLWGHIRRPFKPRLPTLQHCRISARVPLGTPLVLTRIAGRSYIEDTHGQIDIVCAPHSQLCIGTIRGITATLLKGSELLIDQIEGGNVYTTAHSHSALHIEAGAIDELHYSGDFATILDCGAPVQHARLHLASEGSLGTGAIYQSLELTVGHNTQAELIAQDTDVQITAAHGSSVVIVGRIASGRIYPNFGAHILIDELDPQVTVVRACGVVQTI